MKHAAENTLQSPQANGTESHSLWGLDDRALHDAYWRARGVQPIARGSRTHADRAAELYLLLEPGDLVIFDLREVIEPMTWNGAVITRARVVEEDRMPYRERIVTGEKGFVARIERRYHAQGRRSCRALVTRSRRIARIWGEALSRSAGWRQIRRRLEEYQVEDLRCLGHCFDAGAPDEGVRLMSALVGMWPDPGRSIAGIAEIADGVWAAAGTPIPECSTLVGPIWLGRDRPLNGDCLIGPEILPDNGVANGHLNGQANGAPAARVLAISEIELPESVGRASPASAPNSRGESEGGHSPPYIARRDGFFSLKRLFDLTVSAAVLTATAPLFAAIALAVLLDDGRPIFFGHVRQTRGGRLFRCWKFRTMKRNADEIKKELAAENVCDGPQFYVENDPRVTRVGRVLRKWHLDELPQFWNVLRGHMSIVGPRPSPDDENQYCPAWRELRLSVRPGITGLWQIERTRRPGMDFQEWIRYDIEYVQKAGFWFDMTICFRTFLNIIGWRKKRAAHETQ